MESFDCHVLVVDDDDVERESQADLLVEEGYWVSTAHHGLEALQRMQENPDVNLVLLDVNMPVMNGLKFLEEKANSPGLAPVKVLLISGRDFESNLFGEGPYDAFLKKPIAPEALRLSVATRLNLSRLQM